MFVLSSALCFVIRVVFFCLSSCETLTSCHSFEFKKHKLSHTHTHTHSHTYTLAHSHSHTLTHNHTHNHSHTITHTQPNTHNHTQTQTHTNTHKHTQNTQNTQTHTKHTNTQGTQIQYKTRQDKTRQDKTRQDKTRQDKTRQDKTRQDKTRQDKTRQDKTRQDKTRQDKTRQDKTRQDKTRQDKTRQDKTKQYNTIQYNTIQHNTIHTYIHTYTHTYIHSESVRAPRAARSTTRDCSHTSVLQLSLKRSAVATKCRVFVPTFILCACRPASLTSMTTQPTAPFPQGSQDIGFTAALRRLPCQLRAALVEHELVDAGGSEFHPRKSIGILGLQGERTTAVLGATWWCYGRRYWVWLTPALLTVPISFLGYSAFILPIFV